jgi:hypothetical protein
MSSHSNLRLVSEVKPVENAAKLNNINRSSGISYELRVKYFMISLEAQLSIYLMEKKFDTLRRKEKQGSYKTFCLEYNLEYSDTPLDYSHFLSSTVTIAGKCKLKQLINSKIDKPDLEQPELSNLNLANLNLANESSANRPNLITTKDEQIECTSESLIIVKELNQCVDQLLHKSIIGAPVKDSKVCDKSTTVYDIADRTSILGLQCRNESKSLRLQHLPVDRGKTINDDIDMSNSPGGCALNINYCSNNSAIENIESDVESEDEMSTAKCNSMFSLVESDKEPGNNTDSNLSADNTVFQCEDNTKRQVDSQNIPIDKGKCTITNYSYWNKWSGGWDSWNEYNGSMDAYLEQVRKSKLSNNYIKPDNSKPIEVLEKDNSINRNSIHSASSDNSCSSRRNAHESNANKICQSSSQNRSDDDNDDNIIQSENDNEHVTEQSKSFNSVSSSNRSINNDSNETNSDCINSESRSSSSHDDIIEVDSENQSSLDSSQSHQSEYGGYW